MLLISSSSQLIPLISSSLVLGVGLGFPQIDWGWTYRYFPWRFLAWTIPAGLISKFFFARFTTSFSLRKCILVDAAINFVSSGIDILAVPLAGLAVYALELLFQKDFPQPWPWILVLLMVALIHAALETSVLLRTFQVRVGKKGFWLLFCANVVCLSVGVYGLAVFLRSHKVEAYLLRRAVGISQVHNLGRTPPRVSLPT